jgi:hypothetical protein
MRHRQGMQLVNDRRQVQALFDRWGEVIHVRDADDAGTPRSALRRLEHRDELVRVAKAAFVRGADWAAADDWKRFRFRALGFGLCAGPDTYLTGAAGCVVHELPTIGSPPLRPTAVRPGDAHRAPNRTVHGRVRWGYLPPHHRAVRSRIRVVSPAYAAIDMARHDGTQAGLVAVDNLLHRGTDPEIVARLLAEMVNYPGITQARWALEHADARCESPVETLGRYAFLAGGWDPPLSNVWVTDGSTSRRVDHLIPEYGIVIEGDGDIKYDNRPDASDIIKDEKARERWLRNLGFAVVRYTYAIAMYHPDWLLVEVAREIARHRHRPAPTCWSLDPPWRQTA